MPQPSSIGDRLIIHREHVDALFDALRARGYTVVGPRVSQGAIVYDELASSEDLPIGWTDEQQGGTYRLKKRPDQALFGYAVGPHSWKKFLHPPVLRLWQARREGKAFAVEAEKQDSPKLAFIGVRSCELHAIGIQDKVFLQGPQVDPAYRSRRERAFIVAVNCAEAAGTCFCASMKAGPKATGGFDLALTEVLEDGKHYFVTEIGSDAGAELANEIPHEPAGQQEISRADGVIARTAESMGRTMDTTNIKELLYRNYDHPRWQNVASRCLTCANCTMVCPTCFCTTVEDVTDLTGNQAERWRKWDSCFTVDFSYIHGGSVRSSALARYRQWMTHKLATWIDQFGTSGCVGCGRCITWCPVGIDITEEVRAIRATDHAAVSGGKKDEDGNA